jgi:hypothetical protein
MDHPYDENHFISKKIKKIAYYLLKLPIVKSSYPPQLPKGGAVVKFKLIDYVINSNTITPGSCVYLKIPWLSLDFQTSEHTHSDRIPLFFDPDSNNVCRHHLAIPLICWHDVQNGQTSLSEITLQDESGGNVTFSSAYFLFEYTLRYDSQLSYPGTRGRSFNPDSRKKQGI